ncbi:MAG: malonyl-ACP O-methyltransferase BioC [Gammaproteobacteria bacterium]|nr:malonyl-ACP O-methyltransferase BioC [Gammaproteobacteria bacterium]MBI5616341.1 malonyl-ACP O-methyltransferase BioC [Gammaproteobacteria bacterium]
MNGLPQLDKRSVRLSFDDAASRYDEFAALQRLIGERLVGRLDYMRLVPEVAIDLGAGTGQCARALERRYGRARVVLVDLAANMLTRARAATRRWRRRQSFVCADVEHLPLRDACSELIVSNLAMQWCDAPVHAFRECHRVLKPGGLMMFSTLGPDTLKELRAAWAEVDDQPRVNVFMDMHDVGDALIQAGFSAPVLDREILTVTYDEVVGLLRDLKGVGAHNGYADRARGLLGKRQYARMIAAYERFRTDDRLPATYEVVYGHAWAPHAQTRPQDGSTVATFPLRDLKRR